MSDDSNVGGDPVLVALGSLVADLEKNLEATRLAIEQAQTIKNLRAQGQRYIEIVDGTGRPLVVELITENMERLRTSGAALRQAQAIALHDEGMTMDQIAEIYGVTRQRISALLRGRGKRPD